jgi:hypothetical protein
MCRDPLQSGVAFLQLRGKLCTRERGVLDEDTGLARANHQVTQEPLVILEVPGDPKRRLPREQEPWYRWTVGSNEARATRSGRVAPLRQEQGRHCSIYARWFKSGLSNQLFFPLNKFPVLCNHPNL